MSTYIALRDRRLRGGVPARTNLRIVNTDAGTTIGRAFAEIVAASPRGGSAHTLFVLCHGYAGSNQRAGVCMDAGGMGLQLGRENVLHSNVSLWTAVRGKVQNIVVYACAAANTEPGNEGTSADGRYLMSALAIHTNAHVFAADRIQWYMAAPNHGRFDFGEWEGKLWHFPPSGGQPTANGPLVDFNDVMTGTAP